MAREPAFEARLAGGIHLWDATPALPSRGEWGRRAQPIRRLYLHHSGSFGPPGLAGLDASARYTLRRYSTWAGTAYHYWLPHEPERDEHGALVVYRGQPDDRHSYHTGGVPGGPSANAHGLSICLQGDLTDTPPSHSQIELLEGLIPWLRWDRHAATLSEDRWLSWHSESAEWGGSGKASCPGPHVERWAQRYRERAA